MPTAATRAVLSVGASASVTASRPERGGTELPEFDGESLPELGFHLLEQAVDAGVATEEEPPLTPAATALSLDEDAAADVVDG